MIWDFIRDFFVQYIFGGYTSNGDFFGGLVGNGLVADSNGSYGYDIYVNDMSFKFEGALVNADYVGDFYITMGDWLSTTATIIVMCLIVFLLICLVRWIFRAVSSAMLLK